MKHIIFATSNEGKMKEIRLILKDLGIPVLSLKEAGISVDIVEDGTTFEENAIIKVKAIRPYTDGIILADDSGLEVDYLNKQPGVYSARFMGGDTPYTVKNQWIIDGNYQRTIEKRLRLCDTVFLLDYPLELCLSSIESRVGKKRSDMPWVETEFDEEFRQSVVDFPKSQLPSIYNMLEKVKDKKVVIFKSRKQADDYLQEMKKMGK